MARIILSYRRADSAAMAGRIFDRLVSQYGEESVFMDIDIPFGKDFRKHIDEVLREADVVLAVVGKAWCGAGRINEASDPVRLEIETSFRNGIAVIPLLIDGATMPGVNELPETLHDFSYLNAPTIDAGRDFRPHMDRLGRAVDRILADKQAAIVDATAKKRRDADRASEIVIVDTERDRSLFVLKHGQAVQNAAFTADGRRIVTGSKDGMMRLWNAETAKEIGVLKSGAEPWPQFSSNGRRIVTGDHSNVWLWDADTAKEVGLLIGALGRFSPDGRQVITSKDELSMLWDAATARRTGTVPGSVGRFSGDGRRIVTILDERALLWDVEIAKVIAELKAPRGRVSMLGAVSHDGRHAVIHTSPDGWWLWATERETGTKISPGGLFHLSHIAFSPDGRRLIFNPVGGWVRMWDVGMAKEIAGLRGQYLAASASFSPDGRHVVTAHRSDARLWDVETAKEIAVLDFPASTAAFSPDGTQLVTASNDATARLWNIESAIEIGVLKGHDGEVTSAAFSPDGRRILTASGDSTARIWDAKIP